jgi:hypothetical protein
MKIYESEPLIDKLPLHMVWATSLYNDLWNGLDNTELASNIKKMGYKPNEVKLNINAIPILGVAINIGFDSWGNAKELMEAYEIHPAIIRTIQVFIYG